MVCRHNPFPTRQTQFGATTTRRRTIVTESGRTWTTNPIPNTTWTRGPRQQNNPLTPVEQRDVSEWLRTMHYSRQRRVPLEPTPTLEVMLVAEADNGLSRGFYLARIQQDGTIDDRRTTNTLALFTDDFSYYDSFHAGGDRESEIGQPHQVIRGTHISHPFRSRGSDRIDGSTVDQRWKLNIATPIWNEPKSHVIGLLVLGLDVEQDLKQIIYPPELRKPDAAGLGYGIDEKVKVVVADHRGRWVWHPDCEAVLHSDHRSSATHSATPI